MSVTRQHFEDTISANHPAKYFNVDYCPVTKHEFVFALDTAGECQSNFSSKVNRASHIWSQDRVVYDSDGTFARLTVNTVPGVTITMPSTPLPGAVFTIHNVGSPWPWYAGVDHGIEIKEENQKKPKECECGAHSVGSKRHDKWCQLLGEI
jgi:hypothetical protein